MPDEVYLEDQCPSTVTIQGEPAGCLIIGWNLAFDVPSQLAGILCQRVRYLSEPANLGIQINSATPATIPDTPYGGFHKWGYPKMVGL